MTVCTMLTTATITPGTITRLLFTSGGRRRTTTTTKILTCEARTNRSNISTGDTSTSRPIRPQDRSLALQRRLLTRCPGQARVATDRAQDSLADQHMCQQPRASHSTSNRPTWCRRLHDSLAVPATQLRPHITNHHEVRRQVVQYLGDVFSEFP